MILRRIRTAWLRRVVTLLRWSRFTAYTSISLAGAAAMIWPPQSIRAATDSDGLPTAYAWAGVLVVSAAFCAYGAFADRWIGEHIGLIPLGLMVMVFAGSALARGPMSWSGGLFLFGFFWGLVARWQEVTLIRIEAERAARDRARTARRLVGGDPA